jgi:hypothetical protein
MNTLDYTYINFLQTELRWWCVVITPFPLFQSIYISFTSIHIYTYQLDSNSIEMVIHCDHPNSAIHQFNGSLMIGDKQLSLDESSLLLRGNTCIKVYRYEYVYTYIYIRICLLYICMKAYIYQLNGSLTIGDKQLSLEDSSLLLRGKYTYIYIYIYLCLHRHVGTHINWYDYI